MAKQLNVVVRTCSHKIDCGNIFAEKFGGAFALQKLLTIFGQKIWRVFCLICLKF